MDEKILIPVSAVAEFLYCPRNFFYRMAEGADDVNAALIDGQLREEAREVRLSQTREGVRQSRKVRIQSTCYGLTAELDVVEEKDGKQYPVEYKRGRLKESPHDDVQVCLQTLLLEEQLGIDIDKAYLYYAESSSRRVVLITQDLRDLALQTVEVARSILEEQVPPPPLNDERCEGCSLAARCLPEETSYLQGNGEMPTRPLPSADLGRVLYVDTYAAYLRKREGYIQITKDKELLQEVPMTAVDQVVLVGQVNATTPLLEELLRRGIPTYFCQYGGRLSGWLQPAWGKNCLLRLAQFRGHENPQVKLILARSFVRGKLSNYRTMLLRYQRTLKHPDILKSAETIQQQLQKLDERSTLDELRGAEGLASRAWFEALPLLIKKDGTEFFFVGRNRRPPRDPVNAMLSFGYAMLVKDVTGELMRVGLDPYFGFLHSSVYGRPALALDLMEEFRSILVDSAVLTAINTGMVGAGNFESNDVNCLMNEGGRKSFFQAYRNRMTEEIIHPTFGYKLTYRRVIELQARILAKYLTGELSEYRPFMVR